MSLNRAFWLALATGFAVAFLWWGQVRYTQGFQAREIEVQEARDQLQREYQRQAQASREAARAIRAAEVARDQAIQEALDALPSDARQLVVHPDALGVLRAIGQ